MGGDFAPQGTFVNQDNFRLSSLRTGTATGIYSGYRSRVLLTSLQCMGRPAPNDMALDVSSAQAETLICITQRFKHSVSCEIQVYESGLCQIFFLFNIVQMETFHFLNQQYSSLLWSSVETFCCFLKQGTQQFCKCLSFSSRL